MIKMDARNRALSWALATTMIFTIAHTADELWAAWDIGATVGSSFEAAAIVVTPLVFGLWAFAWVLLGRPWGYALAAVVAVAALWPPLTHVLDTEGMTAYRWAIVSIASLAALSTLGIALRAVFATKPWSRSQTAGRRAG